MPDKAAGPDLTQGIDLAQLADGAMLAGMVGEDEVLLARRGDELFAIDAHCSHYHGPLVDGLLVDDTVRCPWHHACFSLRTGEALRAPALDAVRCWRVERDGTRVRVREPMAPSPSRKAAGDAVQSILIVGGGAAGLAAADMLRREGYEGALSLLSADAVPPVDRPNLSKDYLAGTAQEEWIPLRADSWYTERGIDLRTATRVTSIDVASRTVRLDRGDPIQWDRLLLATGSDPVRIDVPGAAPGQVLTLRTLADSKAIITRAAIARRVLVLGASFIGLEVAASLRARGLEVHVVAPDATPLERVLGPEVGSWVRRLHESHGVVFHLGQTVQSVQGTVAMLKDGTTVPADFIVAGVGVRPSLELATAAGLAMDRGVLVNEMLETSAPGIFAAGDIARWPDGLSGEPIRVEHWVVAERQGQVAARNMMGRREAFDAVPFFWSQHYDTAINYVGHAEKWDEVQLDGTLDRGEWTVRYRQGGRTLAMATMGRDLESLHEEFRMEHSGRRA